MGPQFAGVITALTFHIFDVILASIRIKKEYRAFRSWQLHRLSRVIQVDLRTVTKIVNALELKTSYFCSLRKQVNTAIEHKILIGRLEKIHFPKLSLYNLDAKIDTGAYTSSLHCHHITTKESTGAIFVRFFVLDPDHPEYENRPFEIPVHKIKNVKSSNGIIEERVVIKQKIEIAGKSYTIDLSLTNRAEMKYPVLLGRRFLNEKFIVDVSKKYLFKQTQ